MRRLYLVQDFEPFFYPRGGEYALVEDSYRFGFRCVAVGHMVADVLRERIGMTADVLEFGCDTAVYRLGDEGPRDGIVFYAKPRVARRGFLLGALGLQEVHRRRPEVPIMTVGDADAQLPFPATAHGVRSPAELAELYNRCRVGLALSFTNVSLLAEELLACGTVPVINDAAYARADEQSDHVRWAPPDAIGDRRRCARRARCTALIRRPWPPARDRTLGSPHRLSSCVRSKMRYMGRDADDHGAAATKVAGSPSRSLGDMAAISSTPRNVHHDYVAQMRDAFRDMPLASSRLHVEELRTLANYWRHRVLRSGRSFELAGRTYPYYYGRYNTTWHHERAVEIPVAWDIVSRFEPDRVLEVGNVLPHYFKTSHLVLDKDEADPRVVNTDVIDYVTDRRFDLVVTISTLEHVGFDYSETAEPGKIVQAIDHLRGLLSPTGHLLITLPMGYNPHLDEFLRAGEIRFDRQLALQRISADNRWREVTWKEIARARYNDPYRGANGLVIGIIGADEAADLPGLGRAASLVAPVGS